MEMTVEQIEASLTTIWNLLFDDDAFAFAAVEAGGLQFESLPGVNLVRVTAADGSAPIMGSGGGKEFSLPLFFSKLDGTWIIVD